MNSKQYSVSTVAEVSRGQYKNTWGSTQQSGDTAEWWQVAGTRSRWGNTWTKWLSKETVGKNNADKEYTVCEDRETENTQGVWAHMRSIVRLEQRKMMLEKQRPDHGGHVGLLEEQEITEGRRQKGGRLDCHFRKTTLTHDWGKIQK